MLHKTNGIVLRSTKYSETSIIVKIFTEKFGVQTYLVNGVHSAKAKGKAALYQHGNLLDLVVYYRESGNIFRISEAKLAFVYQHIPFDIVLSSLLLFCIELLNKTQKEHVKQEEVFEYVQKSFVLLDGENMPVKNFHIAFLLGLSKHLGFFPSVDGGKYFLLQEGIFSDAVSTGVFFLDEKFSTLLKKFLPLGMEQAQEISLPAVDRKQLLHYLIQYFSLHIEGFGEMRSPEILNTVFS
ncbi:MAG: DNA repair protein RecO [Chitinophagales bacterium]